MTEVFTIQRYQSPFVFTPFFTVLISQAIVWLVGRNDIDIEWWKALSFGLISTFLLRLVAYSHYTSGIFGVVLGLILTMIVLWVIAGFFYDIGGWRRLLLSALCVGCVLLALLIEKLSGIL